MSGDFCKWWTKAWHAQWRNTNRWEGLVSIAACDNRTHPFLLMSLLSVLFLLWRLEAPQAFYASQTMTKVRHSIYQCRKCHVLTQECCGGLFCPYTVRCLCKYSREVRSSEHSINTISNYIKFVWKNKCQPIVMTMLQMLTFNFRIDGSKCNLEQRLASLLELHSGI